MYCPKCCRIMQVSDSRKKNNMVKRRRYCRNCNLKFTTYEVIQFDQNSLQVCPSIYPTKKQPSEIYTEILNLLTSLGKSMGLVKSS